MRYINDKNTQKNTDILQKLKWKMKNINNNNNNNINKLYRLLISFNLVICVFLMRYIYKCQKHTQKYWNFTNIKMKNMNNNKNNVNYLYRQLI